MEESQTMDKKRGKFKKGLIITLILIGLIFLLTGFFVIQPIGAIPDGVTVWYFRIGLDLPFITSPDGYSIKKTGELSLLSRMMAMSTITTAIKDRVIIKLPYIKSMYLISTGGKEFGQ